MSHQGDRVVVSDLGSRAASYLGARVVFHLGFSLAHLPLEHRGILSSTTQQIRVSLSESNTCYMGAVTTVDMSLRL